MLAFGATHSAACRTPEADVPRSHRLGSPVPQAAARGPKAKPAPKAKRPSGKAKAKAAAKHGSHSGGKLSGMSAESQTLVDRLFVLADDNGSDNIQFQEFLDHHRDFLALGADAMEPERAAALHRMQTDKEVEIHFHNNDTDHNLCLDREEFSAYMESMHGVLGKRLFAEVCEQLIKKKEQHKQLLKDGFNLGQSHNLLDKAKALFGRQAEFQQTVEKLLGLKADPNFADHEGNTPLICAAEKAGGHAIKTLMDARANPAAHNKDMECAAFLAARARNMEVLEALLLTPASERPQTAADAQPAEVLRRPSLLDRVDSLASVSQETRDELGDQLVKRMCDLIGAEVKEILGKKADPNFKDHRGWTPLTMAAFYGKADCVEVLLRTQRTLGAYSLRVDGRNGKGRTSLHVAARKGQADLIPLLIAANADQNLQDTDGWTALHHAAFNGQNTVVRELIRQGATADIRGRNGFTPLMASLLPARAGNLDEEAVKLLEVPETVAFGKRMAPILNDDGMAAYDKLQALLELPGVQYNPGNLRLHEQFFPSMGGPSKVRLQKFWESLVGPLFRRFRSGQTDLDPPEPHMADAMQKERRHEIEHRWEEQKIFVREWLRASQGPRPSADWSFQNRGAYIEDMEQVISAELASFRTELDRLYEATKAQPGGVELTQMPAEEILNRRYCSQLHAHPIPVWVEQPDAAGAFEALRLVHCGHMGKDDDESVQEFAEMMDLSHAGLDTGKEFWTNVYRVWLHSYAEAVDGEFQKCIEDIVENYNRIYEEHGQGATFKRGKPKTYDRILAKEKRYGEASWETYESRTLCSKVLDIVRCSICVKTPEEAITLINDFFRPLDGKHHLELVLIHNRFNEKAETLAGYRCIQLFIYWDGGYRAGTCGRPDAQILHALVGEVQIVLEDYLAVKKRRHIIYKCRNGVYDWPADDLRAAAAATRGDSTALVED